MSRSTDDNSWAAQQARSESHARLMHNIAWADKDIKYEVLMRFNRMGSQSAREGPAKPSQVGSIPTPCSKD